MHQGLCHPFSRDVQLQNQKCKFHDGSRKKSQGITQGIKVHCVRSMSSTNPFSGCPFLLRQVSKSDGEALASRYGCLFFEVSACLDFRSVQHVFYEAVRRARRDGKRGCLVPAVYISEDRALLNLSSAPTFTTPCYKELPAPATAKLVTVKTSRAQSKRRAATLTLLKGFKIF